MFKLSAKLNNQSVNGMRKYTNGLTLSYAF